jgi:uncharacterized protein YbaP (TraB family)
MLFSSFAVTSCSSNDEQEIKADAQPSPSLASSPDGSKGLLWEVHAKEGEGKLYLLGSFHVGTEAILPMSSAIVDNFYNSEALIVEMVIHDDIYETEQDKSTSYYSDGSLVSDHLDEKTFAALESVMTSPTLKDMVPDEDDWRKLRADVLSQLITLDDHYQSNFYDYYGVESILLNEAVNIQKPILEVENYQFQKNLLMENGDLILSEMLENRDTELMSTKKLYEAWLLGDLESFEKHYRESASKLPESFTDETLERYNNFQMDFYSKRNLNMSAKAYELLSEGKTYFYTVGASHMIGDDGIVETLKKEGFEVTQLK